MTTGEAVTGVTRHWGTLRPGSLAHSLRLEFGEEGRRLVPPFVMIRSGASSAHSRQRQCQLWLAGALLHKHGDIFIECHSGGIK